jgi:hypothetical protein
MKIRPGQHFHSICRLIFVLALLAGAAAWAQMTTGNAMQDFDKTFNISAKDWKVHQIGCSLGSILGLDKRAGAVFDRSIYEFATHRLNTRRLKRRSSFC